MATVRLENGLRKLKMMIIFLKKIKDSLNYHKRHFFSAI